jgi:hypothetical protein
MRWNMIRRQSGWYARICAAFIVAAAALHAPTANAEPDHYFVALDGTWKATDVVWSEIETEWLVATTIEVVYAPNRGLTAPEMFEAFCGEIVRARLAAPSTTTSGNEIFRVDINILDPNGRPISPVPTPITVKAGKCQVESGAQNFLTTYPGKLQGWYLANGNVQKYGDTFRRIILFESAQGSDAKVADFDMELACTATLNDPTIQKQQNDFEKRIKDATIEPNIVVIFAKERATQGVFANATFDTSDGTCVALK